MNCGKAIFLTTAVWLGATTVSPAWPQSEPDDNVRSAPSVATAENARAASSSKRASVSRSVGAEDENYTETRLGMSLLKNLTLDQRDLWASPARLRARDADWLVPFGGITAGFLFADRNISATLSNSSNLIQRSRDFSNLGVASLMGTAGGFYLWGKMAQDDHERETGVLSGEAVLNSLVVTSVFKLLAGRERPDAHSAAGDFRRGGSSFPSEHAAAAWAVAGILAHEYPGPLTRVLAYGLATAVTVSRVSAKDHFSSDVLIGSAIGYLASRQVYRAHHNPELAGDPWGSPPDALASDPDPHSPSLGATFVPLESWVYPALDRLMGLGYAPTALTGLKPWTRMECARLTDEAGEALRESILESGRGDDLAASLQAALEREFAYEFHVLDGERNQSIGLESAYVRVASVSGAPLNDGYHFGQTVSYDFGRPFRQGTNMIAGSAVRGTMGPLYFYVSGEFEHSPSAPPLSDTVRSIIASTDSRPVDPAHPFDPINQGRLLDTYVGINFRNWQFTFGKQSLSWGPGLGGGLLWSDNAEPMYMLRVTRVVPFELPSIFHFLGPMRIDQFIGQPDGRTFIPHPYIYGQKISLRPSRYFEIGFARTVTLGGRGGDAFTAKNFFRSFFGLEGSLPGPGVPGDSRSAVDWNFLIPGLRNYFVLYADMFSDDDELPWVSPPRSTFRPGLYLTHVPGLRKLDFRAEAASSESPGFPHNHGNLNYFNAVYRDGYTSDGFLLGNTVGRMGRVIQLWSTYWFSPRNSLQLSLKSNSVSSDFIPGGGHWRDYSLRHEIYLRSGVYLRSFVQFERLQYPALSLERANNVTASLEVSYSPGWMGKR